MINSSLKNQENKYAKKKRKRKSKKKLKLQKEKKLQPFFKKEVIQMKRFKLKKSKNNLLKKSSIF